MKMLAEYRKMKSRILELDDKLPMERYAGGIMKERKK